MNRFANVVVYATAFGAGVVLDWLVVGLYVQSKWPCPPELSTCDAGAFTSVIFSAMTAPLAGILALWLTSRVVSSRVSAARNAPDSKTN